MSNWSEGYTSDINYTFGYYSELNPNNMIIPLLMAGFKAPEMLNACELGFGQGISLNIHATGGQAKWYATDFNPSHANFAQQLSQIANNGALIADQGFKEFCQRDDLPEFDFIGLHGIWSWISDENRQIIVDFLQRKLKVGGVLYISYNTLPGWSAPSPLRHLLSQYHSTMTSASSDYRQNIQQSIDFVEKIFQQSPQLIESSPHLLPRLQGLKEKEPNYIVHEYLNQDWQPMYFSDIQKWLEQAKLSFACSSNYLDDFDMCLYSSEQQQLMSSFNHTNFAQTVKDFIVNKQFRRDFWIKGGVKLNGYQKRQAWRKLDVLLLTSRHNIEMKASAHLTIDLNADLFNPILDKLQDHKVHNVGKLADSLKKRLSEYDVFAALAVLSGKGHLSAVQSNAQIKAARPRCDAFNRYILEQSRSPEFTVDYLVSPVIGAAYRIKLLDRWFLLAYIEQVPQENWVTFVFNLLKESNATLNKNDQPLHNDEDITTYLTEIYDNFCQNHLPMLKHLGII
ncbi:hypothetical protein RO21_08080 [[Actinobacillus] muris]|uniref:Methyltransferase regulatory domain-containing protein n=1 Tax=Muribacter muris TaxID=67855 RepID=A0A0J5P6K5_9PAST|nr:class I SAM-dependent methyltransferase [Muribacter muris]KMK51104.1 hypothetical protein RO21_08080 [[Actinobacillus] muris] [Muribacter muris]